MNKKEVSSIKSTAVITIATTTITQEKKYLMEKKLTNWIEKKEIYLNIVYIIYMNDDYFDCIISTTPKIKRKDSIKGIERKTNQIIECYQKN